MGSPRAGDNPLYEGETTIKTNPFYEGKARGEPDGIDVSIEQSSVAGAAIPGVSVLSSAVYSRGHGSSVTGVYSEKASIIGSRDDGAIRDLDWQQNSGFFTAEETITAKMGYAELALPGGGGGDWPTLKIQDASRLDGRITLEDSSTTSPNKARHDIAMNAVRNTKAVADDRWQPGVATVVRLSGAQSLDSNGEDNDCDGVCDVSVTSGTTMEVSAYDPALDYHVTVLEMSSSEIMGLSNVGVVPVNDPPMLTPL